MNPAERRTSERSSGRPTRRSLPMDSGTSIAFPILALLLFGAFLFLLAILARTAIKATAPAEGSSRGCVGGCGLAVVLVFLCGIGLAAFAALIAITTGVAAVEHNPIKRIVVQRVPDRPLPGVPQPRSLNPRSRDLVCLTFELDGDASWLADAVHDLLGVDEEEIEIIRRTAIDSRGRETTTVDVFFPYDSSELSDLEHELRRELPRLSERIDPSFPEGLRIDFR